VTALCYPSPPRLDFKAWQVVDPRRHVPFDFQPFMSLSGAAKQNYLSILAPYHRAPLSFEEARGGAVPNWMRTGFSSA